jgi:hypothetical protein
MANVSIENRLNLYSKFRQSTKRRHRLPNAFGHENQ